MKIKHLLTLLLTMATLPALAQGSGIKGKVVSRGDRAAIEQVKITLTPDQIARTLNEWHSPYPAMAKELREAAADLAALKYEVLKKVGDAVGNTQAFRL